ncbi:hypothetical protein ACFQYP_13505 [Nonomuraea antimicrobica]
MTAARALREILPPATSPGPAATRCASAPAGPGWRSPSCCWNVTPTGQAA